MVAAALFSLVLFNSTSHAQQCDVKDTAGNAMIERINRRYDDFFRYEHEQEVRDRKRELSRGENREHLQAREKALEKARLEYLKHRRPPVDHDAKIEAEMLKNTKARAARLEAARQCFVQQELRAEAALKRGRQIPGNKEYDIED
jgi:hypothetical protein